MEGGGLCLSLKTCRVGQTALMGPPFPPASRYVNTLLKLIPLVLGLQEQLRQAVQNGDMETSHGICRIAVALGENHSR